jgi:hypothetical protein
MNSATISELGSRRLATVIASIGLLLTRAPLSAQTAQPLRADGIVPAEPRQKE